VSRVLFVFSVLCTVVVLVLLVLLVRSYTGAFVNPLMDPGM
jgi:hypothetical protein